MHLLHLSLLLSLNLEQPADWTLKVNSTVAVEVPHRFFDYPVIAENRLGFVWYSDNLTSDEQEKMFKHEYNHSLQYAAIGPGLTLGVLLTGGEPFEDYTPGKAWQRNTNMWVPDASLQWNCPQLTLSAKGVAALPCWRLR